MAGSSAPPTATYSYLTARDTQGIALTCSAPKGEPVHGQSMAPNGLTTVRRSDVEPATLRLLVECVTTTPSPLNFDCMVGLW